MRYGSSLNPATRLLMKKQKNKMQTNVSDPLVTVAVAPILFLSQGVAEFKSRLQLASIHGGMLSLAVGAGAANGPTQV
jgi:hypothetical protein